MSVTRQEPGSAGLVQTAGADGLRGEAAHYGDEKSPSARQRLARLRGLIEDRLPDVACCGALNGFEAAMPGQGTSRGSRSGYYE
jgi:hypothetical protein